jgi:hypothetical protein
MLCDDFFVFFEFTLHEAEVLVKTNSVYVPVVEERMLHELKEKRNGILKEESEREKSSK